MSPAWAGEELDGKGVVALYMSSLVKRRHPALELVHLGELLVHFTLRVEGDAAWALIY